jgi:hypothetical protein
MPMTRPETSQECAVLCQDAALADRLACALKLSTAGRAVLASHQTVPEACRPLDASGREECVAALAAFAPCEGDGDIDSRYACAAGRLGYADGIPTKATCATLSGTEKKSCLADAARAERSLALFRIDDLLSYVRGAYDHGGNLDVTVRFLTAATQAESDFLAAQDAAGMTAALHAAQDAWTAYAGHPDAGLSEALAHI